MLGREIELFTATFNAIEAIVTEIDKGHVVAVDDVNAARTQATIVMGIAAAVALLLAALVATRLTRSVTRSIGPVIERIEQLVQNDARNLDEGLGRLAEGDLTRRATASSTPIPAPAGDEIGRIATAVNGLVASTAGSIAAYETARANLGQIVTELDASSSTIASSSQEMASASEGSGRASAEIAHAISNVAEGAERQAQMVGDARATAETASAAAADGARIAARMAEAMGDLDARSDAISAIVGTITGIADQTNLLALNAAIEAARAGDQGRGFAVVAEEVRKLAEESQAAARSIGTLISEIQTASGEAVGLVRREAVEAFSRVGDQVSQIHLALNEISSVSEATSAATEEVSATTEETIASTEQIAANAHQLAMTADALLNIVTRFTRIPQEVVV